MSQFTGKDLHIEFCGVVLSGRYKSFDETEEVGLIDASAGADTYRTYLVALEDGSASLDLLAEAGGTAIWEAIDKGTEGTLKWYEEGTAINKPAHRVNAVVKSRKKAVVHDDIVKITVAFQFDGAVSDEIGITIPMSVYPIWQITDRPAMSAILRSDDWVTGYYPAPTTMNDFTQGTRAMVFRAADDGYDTSAIPAAVADILSVAATYGVDYLIYNLEWSAHTPAQIAARLADVRAEFDTQGNTIPILFAPLYAYLDSSYALFGDYVEGFACMMQKVTAGTEGTEAAEIITKARSVITNPTMLIQISSVSDPGDTERTLQQVLDAAAAVQAVDGVDCLSLWFANDEDFLLEVLGYLRP